LDCGELTDLGRVQRITDDCYSRYLRSDLFEQAQPFSAQAIFEKAETGEASARSRQARSEAAADRVYDLHEHNWHDAS